MSDVCSENSTLAGEELFLETNFFHNNHHRASKTCSCAITTSCQHTLVFEVGNDERERDGGETDRQREREKERERLID